MVFDHIGFNVSDFAAMKAFLSKALQPLGMVVGKEGEGWAGAFVIGPDGHNFEAVCHDPEGG